MDETFSDVITRFCDKVIHMYYKNITHIILFACAAFRENKDKAQCIFFLI